ncbi:MAG: hypothetical protein H9901_02395 [Candidatus Paralactobacillus gallistercoris]|uniref:Uncharacterized protein n=1 Tax=Candidatus Paralactobacillus gallistercoris TaxID=2838724 RepID=A0A948TJQ0_9LACO|nr:hypothetical protein [Candidatus Paralactobacillus gallistercoris]
MTNWRFILATLLTIIAAGLLGWSFANSLVFIPLAAVILAGVGQLFNLENAVLTMKDKVLLVLACVITLAGLILFVVRLTH